MPLHIKVTMPYTTGLSDDVAVNTFTVIDNPPERTDATILAIAGWVRDFYVEDPPALGALVDLPQETNPPGVYLSPVVSRVAGAADVSVYDMGDFPPHEHPFGSPLLVFPFTLPGSLTDGIPQSPHIGLTFEATGRSAAAVEVGVNRPKQRRTGHIKFGPLNVSAVDQAGTGVGRVEPVAMHSLLAAAVDLQTKLTSVLDLGGLGVWSRIDGVVRAMEAFSIDDAFDTLAKRELAATRRLRVAVA